MEIPDDVIQASLILMEAFSDPNTGPTIGFYSPAEIQHYCSIGSSETPPTVPLSRSAINIHHITGHWLTSFYNANDQTVNIYDSLISNSHLENLKPQLSILYGKHLSETACYRRVTQQGTLPLCGVMAIAFAFCCFLGHNPMNFIFNIKRAREHLKNCISAGEVKQFPLLDMYQRVTDNNETEIVDNENSQRVNKPTSHGSTHMSNAAIERNMKKKNTKTKCASDLRTDQDNTKTLLKNYFQDQKH